MVAAFLVNQHIAALGALTGHVLGQAVIFELKLIFAVDVLFQHAGDGIGAGEDGLAPFPGYRRTADTA